MPPNYSLFDLAQPDFNPADYKTDLEVLEIVLTRTWTHCTACDATTLSSWQLMARGERKGRIFWLDNPEEYLRRFPTLPRREWEHTEETGVCIECFVTSADAKRLAKLAAERAAFLIEAKALSEPTT